MFPKYKTLDLIHTVFEKSEGNELESIFFEKAEFEMEALSNYFQCSKIQALLIAVIFVIIIVGIILRSLVSGIYAALPIVAAIVILFGFMGFTKIPLNIATVLVASVAVGIGIDYSIHVITHFKKSIKKGAGIADAISETIEVSGRAIIINVFSVSAGFLVLLFSEMVPLEFFGLLISLSMIGSGLGAMTLLPSILILSNQKRK